MDLATGKSVLDDPRWRTFNEAGFACSCGQRHVGLFPIHIAAPAGWSGPKEYQDDAALTLDGNFLSNSYCVSEGKYFAARMFLPLQMHGAAPAAFSFTVWASMERADFEALATARKNGTANNRVQARARLVNRLSGFANTMNLMGASFQQEDRPISLLLIAGPQLPELQNHELIQQQKDGIDVNRMLELFAAYGHDMRAAAGA